MYEWAACFCDSFWIFRFFFNFSCFASPCVSIWLVGIQEEIRHSLIHSVALDCHSVRDALHSRTAAQCCFKENKNSWTLCDMFCSVLNNLLQHKPSKLPASSCPFFDKFFVLFVVYIYTIYRTILFIKTGNADKTRSTRRRISRMMWSQRSLSIAVTLCQKLPQTVTLQQPWLRLPLNVSTK